MIKKKKILLIPYPAHGHITPILKLASLLSGLNLRPAVVTPDFIHRRILPPTDPGDGVLYLSLSDGSDAACDFFAVERAMEEKWPFFLEELVRKMIDEDGDGGVGCLVVDVVASWAIDVGRRCGVAVAGFWPAMIAAYRLVDAIPRLIEDGVISENGFPINPNAPICLSPNDPTFTATDLPWLIGSPTVRIARFKFWTRTLRRAKTLRCLLTNTFSDECGQQSIEFISNKALQVIEVGPLIMQAARILNGTLWEEDTSCLGWLDRQNEGSVLYASFGSWVSPIEEAKIKGLALALEDLKRPFIWVLGPAWRKGLPDGYAERVATHGRIVSWAPQTEVLRHPSVGCYLTHCGWNSTMEAVQCKKPLLCYPIAGDQFLNCIYIADVWRIGVKIDGFEIKELEEGIRKIIEDEQVSQRIERLNEKLFGNEARSKAMINLSTFIQDLDI